MPVGGGGKSAPVITALTPAIASALEVSMDRIRACACGLRRNFACSMPGSDRSAP